MRILDKKYLEEHNFENDFLSYIYEIKKRGTSFFISNVNCEVEILEINEKYFPIVIANDNYNDCLYVSLISHYIKYIIEEFEKYKIPFGFIFKIFEILLKLNKINKVVYVNQMFLSTNFYPDITFEQIKEMVVYLNKIYPDYAIVFKNVNKHYDLELFENLKKNGFFEIIGRQIYILDKKMKLKNKYRQKQKKDFSFYEKSHYKIQEPKDDNDYKRIEELYTQLYIKKYSEYNPKYNSEFFRLVKDNNLFNLKVFKYGNKIDATYLIYSVGNIITAPAVGYNMELPQEIGLYRMIISNLLRECKLSYECFNMSAGVGKYKIQRGAKPVVEYILIYDKHLNYIRRIIYKLLQMVVNFTIPFLCKKNLCGFIDSESFLHD